MLILLKQMRWRCVKSAGKKIKQNLVPDLDIEGRKKDARKKEEYVGVNDADLRTERPHMLIQNKL